MHDKSGQATNLAIGIAKLTWPMAYTMVRRRAGAGGGCGCEQRLTHPIIQSTQSTRFVLLGQNAGEAVQPGPNAKGNEPGRGVHRQLLWELGRWRCWSVGGGGKAAELGKLIHLSSGIIAVLGSGLKMNTAR